MVRYFQGIVAVVFGIWACLGCSESFWVDLRRPSILEHPNLITVALYGLGRGCLVVHDALGTPLTVILLILSSLFLFWRAFRKDNQAA